MEQIIFHNWINGLFLHHIHSLKWISPYCFWHYLIWASKCTPKHPLHSCRRVFTNIFLSSRHFWTTGFSELFPRCEPMDVLARFSHRLNGDYGLSEHSLLVNKLGLNSLTRKRNNKVFVCRGRQSGNFPAYTWIKKEDENIHLLDHHLFSPPGGAIHPFLGFSLLFIFSPPLP